MATLKISELSVGDWVSCEDVYCEVSYILPNGIIGTTCRNHRDGYEDPLTNLHPIPITAEILEENGFVRSTSQFIVYHTDKVWISYDKPSETWSVTMYINDVTSNLHANINYIHQLQHALRLAGVDKEINL